MTKSGSNSIVRVASAGATIASSLTDIVRVRSVLRDRCHQRDVALAGALEDARIWDAEAARRHGAFQSVLRLATALATQGRVEEAVQILAQGVTLLNAPAPPALVQSIYQEAR